MGSSNLYEDLNDLAFDEKLLKLQDENKKLLDHIKSLENDIGKLCNELTQMKQKESGLKRNISELFKTAKLENERKDKMIAELQSKVDEQVFKRRNRATVYPIRDSYQGNKRIRDDDSPEIIEVKKPKLDEKKETERERYKDRDHKSEKPLDYNRNRYKRDERTNSSDRDRYRRRSRDRDRYNSRSDRNSKERARSRDRTARHEKNENRDTKKLNNYIGDNIKIEIKNERCSKRFDEDLSKRKTSISAENDIRLKKEDHDRKSCDEFKFNEHYLSKLLSNEEPDLIIIDTNDNLDDNLEKESKIKIEQTQVTTKIESFGEQHNGDVKPELNSNTEHKLSNLIAYEKITIRKNNPDYIVNNKTEELRNNDPEKMQSIKKERQRHHNYKETEFKLEKDVKSEDIKLKFESFQERTVSKESKPEPSNKKDNALKTPESLDLHKMDVPKGRGSDEGINGNTSASRRRRCVIKMVN